MAIDLGNTFAKFYLFEKDNILYKEKVDSHLFLNKTLTFVENNPQIEAIIYADVSGKSADNLSDYVGNIKIVRVNSTIKLPFINGYKSKSTLGADRMVLAAAACKNHPKSNVLVIDLGTCITYDFIDYRNTYHGGAISPGFEMRYKALNNFTSKLPLIDHQTPKNPEAKDTEHAIQAGVYFGILDEITARIDYYQNKFESLTVILTGGDANKLPKTLKNTIFAHSNFLADGMLYLLKLNIDP